MKAKDKNMICIFASFVWVYIICVLFGNWQVAGSLRIFTEIWLGLALLAVAGYRIHYTINDRYKEKE